ncbi:MAG: hypothetical protein HYX65_10855 [Gemmatimonadetes bacterium]|nr:hypothetical protein [Gemmatimonadota bacterium]
MSGAFTDQLRARAGAIVLSPGAGARVSVRVQLLESYDVVRIEAPAGEPVLAVKEAALSALEPGASAPEDYVVKHRGVEVLDESMGLASAGIPDRAILSLSHRRRRPVR